MRSHTYYYITTMLLHFNCLHLCSKGRVRLHIILTFYLVIVEAVNNNSCKLD